MIKKNCWEFKKCTKKEECPAYSERKLDSIHGGIKGGRTCWVIVGTLCNGKTQGEFAQKATTCLACDFYNLVHTEESKEKGFKGSSELLKILKG